MSKRDIHIERLQIRMRGIDARKARAAVSDLGHELLSQLSTPGAAQAGAETAAGELRQRIAKKIAGSIKPRINAK